MIWLLSKTKILVLAGLSSSFLIAINLLATTDDFNAQSINLNLDELTNQPSRYWYLTNGSVRPHPQSRNQTIPLYPEEAPGNDRVTEQLMFLPMQEEEMSLSVNNITDLSPPLKKILIWNGLGSWHGVSPGRTEFLKQECPVSTCEILMGRNKAQMADMVLFKDNFYLPSFTRPASQIWTIFMLGRNPPILSKQY